VDDPARFSDFPLKLYTGDQDIGTIFLGTKAPDGVTERVPDLMIFSDEKETLAVVRSGDAIGGIMVTTEFLEDTSSEAFSGT
jgi:hypothetical protein